MDEDNDHDAFNNAETNREDGLDNMDNMNMWKINKWNNFVENVIKKN